MITRLVTFATKDMSQSAQLCISSAFKNGITALSQWTPESALMLSNGNGAYRRLMTTQERGAGYWVWKPTIIRHALLSMFDGDYCVYADAGVEFINNVSHIIDRMGHEKPQDDIFLFGNNWEHAHWCKRDVLDALMPQLTQCPACHKWCGGVANRMPCEAGYYYHPTIGKQVQASVIFFRVSDYTRKFVAEWLKWCLFEGGRLIDDSPSRAPNHPEFQEHRHDQAILTTMAYREGIHLHYWPAVYNRGSSPEFVYEKLPEYAGDDYPILFSHHRRRDHEWI